MEAVTPPDPKQFYPVCTDGKKAVPPEDCGGVWQFMDLRQHYSVGYALELLSEIQAEGASAVKDHYEELQQLLR